jgi:hypothetical protein
MSEFAHPPKGKTNSTDHLKPGELLNLDFSFCDIPSIRGFHSMLLIIDTKTRMLWLFCSSNKRAPLTTLHYFFQILQKKINHQKQFELMKTEPLLEIMNLQNYSFSITLLWRLLGDMLPLSMGKLNDHIEPLQI